LSVGFSEAEPLEGDRPEINLTQIGSIRAVRDVRAVAVGHLDSVLPGLRRAGHRVVTGRRKNQRQRSFHRLFGDHGIHSKFRRQRPIAAGVRTGLVADHSGQLDRTDRGGLGNLDVERPRHCSAVVRHRRLVAVLLDDRLLGDLHLAQRPAGRLRQHHQRRLGDLVRILRSIRIDVPILVAHRRQAPTARRRPAGPKPAGHGRGSSHASGPHDNKKTQSTRQAHLYSILSKAQERILAIDRMLEVYQ
jgi:hypothetical protein